MKKLLSFILLISVFFHYSYTEEIYNFPDLVPSVEPDEVLDEEAELNDLPYKIITNLDFYSLEQFSDSYTYFKSVMVDLMLNEIDKDPESVLVSDFLQYDIHKQMLLSGIRDYRPDQDKENEGIILIDNRAIDLRLYGKQEISFSWGKAFPIYKLDRNKSDLKNEYKYVGPRRSKLRALDFLNKPFYHNAISDGFQVDQNLSINLKGKIGQRIHMEVTHSTSSKANTYLIEYRGRERDVIQGIKIGKVTLNAKRQSQFVTTGGSSKETFGVSFHGKKGNSTFSGLASFTRGISAVKTIKIGERVHKTNRDTDFISARFFQLPDQNVVGYDYFEKYTDFDPTETSASFPWIFALTNTNTGVVDYFTRVEDDGRVFTVDKARGIFRLRSSRSSTKQSILFYTWSSGAGTISTTGTNRLRYYPGYTLIANGTPPANPVLYSNFVVINPAVVYNSDVSNGSYYELRNHYSLLRTSKILENTFEMKLYLTGGETSFDRPWIGGVEHEFDQFGRVTLDMDDGYYWFERNRPFTNTNNVLKTYKNIYDTGQVDKASDSSLFMEISYEEEFPGYIDLGNFNIIANSVVVYRNNVPMDKSEYTVSTFNGRVNFKNTTALLPGQEIRVHYEYRPFGNTLNQAIIAARYDYNIRGNNYIGSTFAMTTGQSSLSAPRAGNEPSRQIVMDVDTSLDLVSLFRRRKNNNLSISLKGEYAFSFYDRNKKRGGLARIMDFESENLSFSLPKRADNYFLSLNRGLETNNFLLGKIYYKDYHSYKPSGNSETLEFSLDQLIAMSWDTSGQGLREPMYVNIRPFETKPGPYLVSQEGHLDPLDYPGQSSLVFEYDFSEPASYGRAGYVSFTSPVGSYFSSTRSFDKYNTLEIIYKLTAAVDNSSLAPAAIPTIYPQPDAVGLMVELGYNLNEDLDGDGVFDTEVDAKDTRGFEFNYSNVYTLNTVLGQGYKGFTDPAVITTGNNRLDSEDINNNKNHNVVFDEVLRKIVYPSQDTLGQKMVYFPLWSTNEVVSRSISNGGTGDTWTTPEGLKYQILKNYSTISNDLFQKQNYVKLTIPLRQTFSNENIDAVNMLRLTLMQYTNTNTTFSGQPPRSPENGQLVINSLVFKGTKWEEITVDNVVVERPKQFTVTTIDSRDDDFYKNNHIATAFRDDYEELYGDIRGEDFDNLIERAFEITYDLNGISNTSTNNATNGQYAKIDQLEYRSMNISYYKEKKVYIYTHTVDNGEEDFVYRFGRNNSDYWEFRIAMSNLSPTRQWHELTFKLRPFKPSRENEEAEAEALRNAFKGDQYFVVFIRSMAPSDEGEDDPGDPVLLPVSQYTCRKIGNPTLYDIQYFSLGIQTFTPASGIFYVNNIIVGDDQVAIDNAYRLGLDIAYKKPIRINDFELFAPISTTFGFNHRGLDFYSIDAPEGRGNNSKSDSLYLGASTGFFGLFTAKYSGSASYNLSEIDQSLKPVEEQSASYAKSGTVDFNFRVQKKRLAKFFPTLSHTYTWNTTESLTADPYILSNLNDPLTNYVTNYVWPSNSVLPPGAFNSNYVSNGVEFWLTNTIYDTDDSTLNLYKNSTETRSVALSENQTLKFSERFSITHKASVRSSLTRTYTFRTNLEKLRVEMISNGSPFDADKRITNYFFPIAIMKGKEDITPAWGFFPELDDEKRDTDTWASSWSNMTVKYRFSRNWSAGMGFNFGKTMRLNLDVSADYSDHINLTNLNSSQLDNIDKAYLGGRSSSSWYLGEVFQDHEEILKRDFRNLEEFRHDSISQSYKIGFNYLRPITFFKKFNILSRFDYTVGYSHKESSFNKMTRTYDVQAYLNDYTRFGVTPATFADFSNHMHTLSNFYINQQNMYKSYQNSFTRSMTFPFSTKKGFISRLSVSPRRSIRINENNALDLNMDDLVTTGPMSGIFDEYTGSYADYTAKFADGASPLLPSEHDTRRYDFFLNRFLSLNGFKVPPYINFGVLNDLRYLVWLIGRERDHLTPVEKELQKAKVKSWLRSRHAMLLDEEFGPYTHGYRARAESLTETNDYYTTKFNVHNDYSQDIYLDDSYRVSLSFNTKRFAIRDVDYLGFLIPTSVSYSGGLKTAKLEGYRIEQTETRNLSFRKNFNMISDLLNRLIFSRKNKKGTAKTFSLSGDYKYRVTMNYNQKTSDAVNEYSILPSFTTRKGLRLSTKYKLTWSKYRQHTRFAYEYYDEDGKKRIKIAPYMGIGDPAKVEYSDNNYTSGVTLREWLNVGSLESPGRIASPSDVVSTEAMDYDSYTHTWGFDLRWTEREPLKMRIPFTRKRVTLPANTIHQFGMSFDLKHYSIPMVDEELFYEGKTAGEDQLNPVGRKNLINFKSPRGIGDKFPRWLYKTYYNITVPIKGDNFSLSLGVKAALLEQIEANNYVKYLKILPDDEDDRNLEDFREDEFLQFGFEFTVKGIIKF